MLAKIYTNYSGHMTIKMAATPIYGETKYA